MYNAPPYFYEVTNTQSGLNSPSTIKIHDNKLAFMFEKYLFQKAISVFEWDIPDQWPLDYFTYTLFGVGFISVINTDRYGVVPQLCSLAGYNLFYLPTKAIISNPLLRGVREPRIGTECEIIHLQPDYRPITDLVIHYAGLMAMATESLSVNLFNSKLPYIFAAKNRSTAESYKKAIDQVSAGNPCVVTDEKLFDDRTSKDHFKLLGMDQGQFESIPGLLKVLHQIETRYDSEIGLINADITWRSRQNTDEVTSNNINTISRAGLWLQTMRRSTERVNLMFGTNIQVDIRQQNIYRTEGGKNASDSDIYRSV